MAADPIPEDIRDFIVRHIDSVAQLEALLLLRNNPAERWDAATIAQRLYVGEQEVDPLLAPLCDSGLINCADACYGYAADVAMRGLVDRLAAVYARQLIPVTNLIHAKPARIHQFADAFRLRKDR